MSDEINIRKGLSSDWDSLADLFHSSVREGAVAYSRELRAAWSPRSRAGADWSLRMNRQNVTVAQTVSGERTGFMSAKMNGYIDCAYILAPFQGQGLFKRLYASLEAVQRLNGMKRLHVRASLQARFAFTSVGFNVIRPETVEMCQGVWLPRCATEKRLWA